MISRRFRALLALVPCLAVSVAAVVAAPTAHADSGFCGVRNGVFVLYNGTVVYQVRNQCSASHTFRVDVPAGGGIVVESGCQNVPGGGIGYYTVSPSYLFSDNWYITNC